MKSLSTNSEADIFSRVVKSGKPSFSTEFARGILTLDFPTYDKERMHALAQKAQEGELMPEERDEIDRYERVGHFLSTLQAQARISLNQATSPR